MKFRRFRMVASGEVVNLGITTNHPLAKPGVPVWVDEKGCYFSNAVGIYAIKPHGFVICGSDEDKLFSFDLRKRFDFRNYLLKIDPTNHETYPSGNDKMRFDGLPDYHFILKETLNGEPRLIIIFDEPVVLSAAEVSDRFIIGNKPAIEMKRSGEIVYPFF